MKSHSFDPRDIPDMSPGLPNDTRPYAIMSGLSGLYMPNECYHVRGLDNAREALLAELDRHGDTLELPEDIQAFEEARSTFIGATDEDVQSGYAVSTDEWNEVRLDPISEEDYCEDDES